MREPDWWRLGIAVPAEDEERAVEALGELGLEGLELVLPNGEGEGEGHSPAPGEVWIRAYVEPSERAGAERALGTISRARPLDPAPISRDAWSGWFEPVRVGAIAVRAAGDGGAPLGEAHAVWLHPGMGFGAGEHPSTRLALAVLQRIEVRGARVIDVGSGTGVLALAALRLGAGSAVAVDIAADARRATRENAALNALELEVLDAPPAGASFDLVVANILIPVLLELQPVLVELAAPGAPIVLSGVRAADLGRLEARYAGWTVVDREDEDGWVAVHLARER